MSVEPSFHREKYQWIKSQIPLDLLDIDEQIIRLPVLLQEASEFVSMANELKEVAKEDVEKTKAELAHELRKQPSPGSGKYRSETQIDKEIPLSEIYQGKLTALSNARLDASLWQSITDALRTKSSLIKVTVDLISAGYLTMSSVRSKRREEIHQLRQENQNELPVST